MLSSAKFFGPIMLCEWISWLGRILLWEIWFYVLIKLMLFRFVPTSPNVSIFLLGWVTFKLLGSFPNGFKLELEFLSTLIVEIGSDLGVGWMNVLLNCLFSMPHFLASCLLFISDDYFCRMLIFPLVFSFSCFKYCLSWLSVIGFIIFFMCCLLGSVD